MSNTPFTQPIYWRSGGPATENEATLSYPGMLGAKQVAVDKSDGFSKEHQLVRTDSTMSVAPFDGATAWWAGTPANYLVSTAPTALGRGRVAGVFRYAITPGNYGAVQTKGRHPRVKMIDAVTAAPTVAGLIVIPSATAGKADTLAAASPATYPSLGVTAGVYNAAAATAAVDLDVPETTP